MISGSQLARYCRHDKDVLDKVPPRTAAERTREANKKASADRGTIFHAAVEAWAKSGTLVPVEDQEIQGWLDLLAHQWRPPATFEAEVKWGLTPGGSYRDVIEPEPHVYLAADGSPLLTAGTADGVWIGSKEDRALYIADWKSGKWPVDPARTNLQVNAAGLALSVREFAKVYIPGIYYPRDGHWDWGDPVELGSPAWEAMLAEVRAAALLDEKPRPGPHCAKCWSRSKCPVSESA